MRRRATRLPLLAALSGLVLSLTACAGASPIHIGPESLDDRTLEPATPASPESTEGDAITEIDYTGAGNHAQTLDLYLPPGADDERGVPLVVFIHGGGWSAGDKGSSRPGTNDTLAVFTEVMLAEGYAVASVNYRLSSEALWPAPIQDVHAATRFLRADAARFGLDPDRFAVAGDSAGGHLALMLALTADVPELTGAGDDPVSSEVDAVISYYGVTDVRTLAAEREAQDCPPQSAAGEPTIEGMLLGIDPSTPAGAELGAEASPVTYARADAPPVLSLHGTSDCVVPFSQSERMHEAVIGAGGSSEIRLGSGGHSDPFFFSDPTMEADTLAFLDAALTG